MEQTLPVTVAEFVNAPTLAYFLRAIVSLAKFSATQSYFFLLLSLSLFSFTTITMTSLLSTKLASFFLCILGMCLILLFVSELPHVFSFDNSKALHMFTPTILLARYQAKDYNLNLDILPGNTFFDKGNSTSRRSARVEQSIYGAVASFATGSRSSRQNLLGRSNLKNSNSERAEGGYYGEVPSFALLAADYFLLHEYVKNGDVKTSEYLIRQGIDVNQKDLKQKEAIHYAACYGNVDLLHLLVSYGADVNALDGTGKTALHISVMNDEFPFVQELILTYSAFINLRDDGHSTAMDFVDEDKILIFLYNNGGFFGVDFNHDDDNMLLLDDDDDNDVVDEDDETLLEDDDDHDVVIEDDETLLVDDNVDDDNIVDEDDETLLLMTTLFDDFSRDTD